MSNMPPNRGQLRPQQSGQSYHEEGYGHDEHSYHDTTDPRYAHYDDNRHPTPVQPFGVQSEVSFPGSDYHQSDPGHGIPAYPTNTIMPTAAGTRYNQGHMQPVNYPARPEQFSPHQDNYTPSPPPHLFVDQEKLSGSVPNTAYDPMASFHDLAEKPSFDGGAKWESDTAPILHHQPSIAASQATSTAVGSQVPPPQPQGVTKQVRLFRGNLVLDCPVPHALRRQIPNSDNLEREFTHMRYTAATCDPSEFLQKNFTLRQTLYGKPRHTELFIVITMYNEDELLFARTMLGVINNIKYMQNRTGTTSWGQDSWKKIVVCVVSDGRANINKRTQAVLAAMGVYQKDIAMQKVDGKKVTSHIYEYTTMMNLQIKKDVVQVTQGTVPIQMLFCLKEENKKKINSHRWFFDAFGPVLKPNVCVLLDAGTKPGSQSIFQLWRAFDLEPRCGGACGEIKAMLNHGKNLINPLVATQNFEYKMSNILDKPFESAFGFISVLPGAFSAYRYTALQNDDQNQGPLQKYFLGEKMHGANAGVFEANMYLAEDRILCFELVSKRKCQWLLQYVKSSTGETDVPTEMAEFISQRRRWLNGSFFAAIYAVAHFYDIFRSSHSFMRQVMFMIEFIYQTISMIFAWFALGNFFLVFRILTQSLDDPYLLGKAGKILATVFQWSYIGTLITCFVLSLGNKPAGSRKFYVGCAVFWAVLMAYLIFASIFITVRSIQADLKDGKFDISELVKNQVFFNLIVSMLTTSVMYLIASILFLDPWHMFTCFVQYLLMTPTYINILNVYAFCNTHDVTWGTKTGGKAEALPTISSGKDDVVDVSMPADDGDLDDQYRKELATFAQPPPKEVKVASPEQKQEDFYKGFRSGVVLFWMFCNLALCAVVLSTGSLTINVDPEGAEERKSKKAEIYMKVILWSVAGLSVVRFIGAVWFLIVRMFRGV